MTIKTTIHTYQFNTHNPAEETAYKALRESLTAQGLRCFESWGGKGHYFGIKQLDGRTIELETTCLFDNQWNTAPVDDAEKGLRLFDWAQDYPINFSSKIKRGHYLTQTDEMRDVRRNTMKCGYCGKQESAQKGYVFCPHCIDSQYLEEKDLHLTRMVAVCNTSKNRAPLTDAERDYLLPLFHKAQIEGSTARGKARIAKNRADIQAEYDKTIANATEKKAAAEWVMNNVPGLLENWIFYAHTGKHCFGWRKPLDAGTLAGLLDKVSEFPFDYEIKCDDGRTLG